MERGWAKAAALADDSTRRHRARERAVVFWLDRSIDWRPGSSQHARTRTGRHCCFDWLGSAGLVVAGLCVMMMADPSLGSNLSNAPGQTGRQHARRGPIILQQAEAIHAPLSPAAASNRRRRCDGPIDPTAAHGGRGWIGIAAAAGTGAFVCVGVSSGLGSPALRAVS